MKLQNNKSEFSCPNCQELLVLSNLDFICNACNNKYPIKDNIIDFRLNRLDYFFNPVSSENMDELISNINKNTWVESIKSFIKLVGAKQPDSWIDNLVVDSRYAWKILLDLNKEKTLLDIGCGLGNLVSNLAPHVGKTYAVDLTYMRLKFAKKRISVFNVADDVEFIAGGDGKFLPFPDNSIDCVTLSGVLEWVGEGDSTPYVEGAKTKRLWNMVFGFFGKRNSRKIQIAFLKEIKRVLKSDGQLFIGIENRLNYEYFTGRPDHHSNLKYASLFPRFIANLYSIIKSKKPYRTYTYCIPGYKKLLSKAGFNNVEFLGLTDGYSFLNGIYPAENNEPNWLMRKRNNLKDIIKYNKYFFPAYGLIASENKKPKNRLQDTLFSEIAKQVSHDLAKNITIHQYVVTQKEKLVIKASVDNKNIIVKIAVNEAAIKSEENNKNLLESISQFKVSPNFIEKVSVDSLTGYVEEMLEGEALGDVYADFSEQEIYGIIAKVIEQKNPSDQFNIVNLTDSFYGKIVETPLNILFEELKDQELDSQLRQYFSEHLYGKLVVMGVTHGDMSVSNILIDKNKFAKLIDWEAGNSQGLPILDVINFLGSEYRLKNASARMLLTIETLTSKDFMNTVSGQFLKEQYNYFNIFIGLHEALVYLNWLHNIISLLPFTLKYNQMDIERFVYDVAKKIKTG